MKFFFFDLETTGVDHTIHGIWQIAAIIETPTETREVNLKVRPRADKVIEDEAIAIGGVTREELAAFPMDRDIYLALVAVLATYVDRYDKTDKFFLCGITTQDLITNSCDDSFSLPAF